MNVVQYGLVQIGFMMILAWNKGQFFTIPSFPNLPTGRMPLPPLDTHHVFSQLSLFLVSPVVSLASPMESLKLILFNFALLVGWSPVKTQVAAPDRASRVTYYFRKAFSLNSSSCYNAINITIFVQDGDIVYLNNVEILRLNLMPGYVDNKTNVRDHFGDFQ